MEPRVQHSIHLRVRRVTVDHNVAVRNIKPRALDSERHTLAPGVVPGVQGVVALVIARARAWERAGEETRGEHRRERAPGARPRVAGSSGARHHSVCCGATANDRRGSAAGRTVTHEQPRVRSRRGHTASLGTQSHESGKPRVPVSRKHRATRQIQTEPGHPRVSPLRLVAKTESAHACARRDEPRAKGAKLASK